MWPFVLEAVKERQSRLLHDAELARLSHDGGRRRTFYRRFRRSPNTPRATVLIMDRPSRDFR